MNELTHQTTDLLHARAGISADTVTLERLPGDASNRRYYRVHTSGGGPVTSYILMELQGDQPAKVFEEATDLKHVDELPFVNVHRYLSRSGAPVPKIHFYEKELGLLLLEDLGDLMLEGIVSRGDWKRSQSLYEQAIRILVDFQAKALKAGKDDCIAFRQRFNEKLFVWEFDHYLEFGVQVRHGVTLTPAEDKKIHDIFGNVSRELVESRNVLCHRDYHSRNLMIQDEHIYLIDFQDALMGPAVYDLASLLRDSYVELPEQMVDGLVAGYLKRWTEVTGEKVDAPSYRRLFDLQSIQRNLKAAGRFVFIDVKKGNPKFLADIPRTLVKVKRNLTKYPELAPVLEILSAYVPELRG